MKTKKIKAIFAKALILTLSLLAANNMWAAESMNTTKDIEKWATKEAFSGAKKENFFWYPLTNQSNKSVTIRLSTPYWHGKRASYKFITLKPEERIDIPTMYLGTDINDDQRGISILFSFNLGILPRNSSITLETGVLYTYAIENIVGDKYNRVTIKAKKKELSHEEIVTIFKKHNEKLTTHGFSFPY